MGSATSNTMPGTPGPLADGRGQGYLPPARRPTLFVHYNLETAMDQALAIEGHEVRLGLQARVLHDLGHAPVAHLTGGEGLVIQEKITVSSGWHFTAMGKEVSFPSGTSSPQHSTILGDTR